LSCFLFLSENNQGYPTDCCLVLLYQQFSTY
jgi:hypothetical protein